jgi:hypothetical protein
MGNGYYNKSVLLLGKFMNRIEIRRVVTPFEKVSLYDMHDARAKNIQRKLGEWVYGKAEGNKIIFKHKCSITIEEIEDLKYVTKIYFYPKENKFEVMVHDILFKTIISNEYSITY